MTDRLFSEKIKVHFKKPDDNELREVIRVTIETQTTTSPLHKKDLIVRITKDSDPLFVYTLCLSEDDFRELKTQQGLLVDFNSFPQNLVGLLEDCIKEQNKDEPRFVLEFSLDGNNHMNMKDVGTLKVIQMNSFRNLQHLSLHLMHANDSDLKKYLSSCLKVCEEKLEREHAKCENTKDDLEEALKKIKEQTEEINKLRSESTGEMGRLLSLHRQDINVEKQKHLTLQEEMQHRYEKEKSEIQSRLQRNIDLKDCALDELKEWKIKAEGSLMEYKRKESSLTKRLDHITLEYEKLSKNNEVLKEKFYSKEADLQGLRREHESNQQTINQQKHRITQLGTSLRTAHQQKEETDFINKNLNEKLEDMEDSLDEKTQDIQKAEEIIRKFKDQLKNYMMKVKVQNEIIVRQEKTVEDQNSCLEKSKLDQETFKTQMSKKDLEIEKLNEENNNKTNKIKEFADLIKSNEHLIKYLNKQINENTLKTTNVQQFPTKQRLSSNNLTNNTQQKYPNNQQKYPNNHAYSTPHTSYRPQSIGVSTLTTSPTLKANSTENSVKTNRSPVRYTGGSEKSKENISSGLPISAQYLMKSTDDTDYVRPLTGNPINVKNLPKMPRQVLKAHQQNNNVVSAYFDGKLPKAQ